MGPLLLFMNSSMRWPPSVSATRPSGTLTPSSAAACSAYQQAPEVWKSGHFCDSTQPAGTASAAVIHGFEARGPLPYAGGQLA